jgi:hypothetical protein
MRVVSFELSGYRQEGELLKTNTLTVWVKLRVAGKVKFIKRHKLKHAVREEDSI